MLIGDHVSHHSVLTIRRLDIYREEEACMPAWPLACRPKKDGRELLVRMLDLLLRVTLQWTPLRLLLNSDQLLPSPSSSISSGFSTLIIMMPLPSFY